MTRKFMAISAAAIAAGLSLGAGVVRAEQPTTEQLMQKIDQLQSKVDQLEAKQTETVSSKDVDATVERVLKDADSRSQMLQMEGFTAGYTKGRFTIQDAAGNWVLRPRFEFDWRSMSSWRDEGKHGGNDSDSETGYQIGRMAFGADGVICNPNYTYLFMWNTDIDGSVALEESWVRYQLGDSWAIKGGQMRSPVFHEQAVGPTNQLLVDTSLANFLITGANTSYTQGFQVEYTDKNVPIWAAVGYEDGYNSANTDFVDPNEGGPADWGIYGRVNWYVWGNRADYNKLSAMGNKDNLLVIGAGGDITQVGDTTSYLHTVDAQWATTGGLCVYVAYLGDYVDFAGTNDTAYNWAVLAQVSYALNDNWEIFAREDYTKLDSLFVGPGASDSTCEFTIGGTYYLCGNNLKFTLDMSFLSNGSPVENKELGVLATGGSEFVYRFQTQLLL